MDIYLTDLATGEQLAFPMLPEKINVQAGTVFQAYTIQSIGDIRFPNGQNLMSVSWDGTLPGAVRRGAPYVKGDKWRPPLDIQGRWNVFRSGNKKLRLQVTDTPIDIHVYLERYGVEYGGGYGDYKYNISFLQAKDLKVNVSSAQAVVCEPRPSPPQSKTYTVVRNDSLWKIAERFYGSGARYPAIYEANKAVIGKDPDKIYPGQVFVIP